MFLRQHLPSSTYRHLHQRLIYNIQRLRHRRSFRRLYLQCLIEDCMADTTA